MNRSLARTFLLVAAALAGCDGISTDPRRDDLHFRIADAELASLDFGEAAVRVGVPPVAVTIVNQGVAASGALALELTGPDAGEFAILDASSDCAGRRLDPAASCVVRMRFLPRRTGALRAALHVVSDAGEPHELTLLGAGRASALVADASVDLGLVEIGTTSTRDITVRNGASTPLTDLTAVIEGTGPIIESTSCTGTLEPQGTCTVRVKASATALAVMTGTLRVTSGAEVSVTSVTAAGAYRVTVTRSGDGTGTVVSNPAGIECGSTCSGLFASAVELTVAPDAGSELGRWTAGPCQDTTASPCVVAASLAPVSLDARIDRDVTKTLTIRVVGGVGGVSYFGPAGRAMCMSECSIEVGNNQEITLTASGPARFIGWSGDGGCASLDTACTVAGVRNAVVTATFAPQARERWTTTHASADEAGGARVAATPDGDLVLWSLSDGHWLSKVDAETGAPEWQRKTTTSTRAALDVAVDENGMIFAAHLEWIHEPTAVLRCFDPAGNGTQSASLAIWAVPATGLLAARPGGGVVMVVPGVPGTEDAGGVVAAYDHGCIRQWTRTEPGKVPRAVAIAPDGVVHVLAGSAADAAVLRYSAMGDPLAPLPLSFDGEDMEAMVIDADGRIVVASREAVHALTAAGEPVYDVRTSPADDTYGVKLAVDASGAVVRVYGNRVDKISRSGGSVWQVEQPAVARSSRLVEDVAAMPDGGVALVGMWRDLHFVRGFLTALAP